MLLVDRDRHRPLADFGVDGDAADDRDRLLDPRLEHPDLAEGRSVAGAAEVEATAGLPSSVSLRTLAMRRLGLEIAEADDDRDGHAIDRDSWKEMPLTFFGGGDRRRAAERRGTAGARDIRRRAGLPAPGRRCGSSAAGWAPGSPGAAHRAIISCAASPWRWVGRHRPACRRASSAEARPRRGRWRHRRRYC